jgi:hypothetical protein
MPIPPALRVVAPLLAVLVQPPTAAAEGSVNGLYPLWEQTGVLHRAGTVAVGYGHAQVGLGRLQLGTQPILDLHGTLNLQAKAALWRGERLDAALVLGGFRLPTAAQGRTVGNLYASGFSNPYAPVWLAPVSLAKTLRVGQRLALHWASTVLFSHSQAPEHRFVASGQTLMAELRAGPRWAARLHGGVEGWPIQAAAHAGLSFAYTGEHVYAAAGLARRFGFDGEGSNQALFDGGVLFP